MTPLRRTSSGRRGSASCTRLLRWNTALSTSVPTSNVAVIVDRAVGRRARAEVDQVLDAGELLLDRRGDGLRERLGARARIARGDRDRRRRDLGILRDRQDDYRRDEAREHDDDREHAREDRALDEEVREHGASAFQLPASGAAAAASPAGAPRSAAALGSTHLDRRAGRTLTAPSTITRSPAARPDSTIQSLPSQSPTCDRLDRGLAVGADDEHELALLALLHGALRHEDGVRPLEPRAARARTGPAAGRRRGWGARRATRPSRSRCRSRSPRS